jgi:hypothetical protein
MLQDHVKKLARPAHIRRLVERGVLPKASREEIYAALRETKAPNVLEMWGFLSARVCRGGEWEDLGLLSCQKVTTAFTVYLVDAMQNSTTSPMDIFKYHGSGTGVTAEANTQTALVTEVETRATGSLTEGASTNIFKTVGTQTYTATRTIAEHGVFSASTSGTMLDRSLLASTVSVENTDTIEWTYELTVNAEA